jgi:hypothetical protein
MNFAFWFAPAAAFFICIARSNLARAAAAGVLAASSAMLKRARSLPGLGFSGRVIRAG